MKIQKKKESFWADIPLTKKLAKIPEGEKSTIIRMALRDYFNLADSKRGIVGYGETVDDIETAIERSES